MTENAPTLSIKEMVARAVDMQRRGKVYVPPYAPENSEDARRSDLRTKGALFYEPEDIEAARNADEKVKNL